MIISLLLVAAVIYENSTHYYLKKRILHNLNERYDREFDFQSLILQGDAANFICYPRQTFYSNK